MMKNSFLFFFLLVSFTTLAQENASDPYRQFDFWVGDWDVYHTSADTLVGKSRITSVLNGVAIREEYQSMHSPYRGNSLNTYNAMTGRWEQYYVDNQGLNLHLKGTGGEGRMVLLQDRPSPQGYVLERITWKQQEDGTVRQMWDQSQDQGNTWVRVFDGTYKPVD